MSVESGLAFFIAIIIFAITPGPGVFALLSRAMTQGAKACYSLAIGMAVSDVLYLIFASLGLAVIAQHWGGFFTVIRILGGIYLIYLGWKMWNDRAQIAEENKKSAKELKSFAQGFLQGFLISASNPKVILFYIAFLPTFIDLTALSAQDIVVVSILCFVGLMIGLMFIAYAAAWARGYFRSDRAMRGLNRVAGSIMMSAGAFLVIRN